MNARMVKTLALTGLVATALLAGCQRREEPQEPAPQPAPAVEEPEVTPADAGAPMSFEESSPYASVEMSFPDAIRSQPDLHARLYREGVRVLRQFSEGAQADRSEFQGEIELPPYARNIEYALALETGKLLSLRRLDYEYAGGAHPNNAYGSVLWDKALRREVGARDLFRRGADLTALDRALCQAINQAKRARTGSSEILTLERSDGWACPRAADTPYVLAPSTTPGRAGGLIFLIGPYVVGPHAEGGYEIAVPLSAFRGLLNAAYADEFDGAPARTGDVTERS